MGIGNSLESTYHLYKNGRTERLVQTMLAILRCYMSDHRSDWNDYAQGITYPYDSGVYSCTHSPFEAVISRMPSDPAIFGDEQATPKKARKWK